MGALSEDVRTEVLCGRICDLEAENAKLRGLLRDVWRHMVNAVWHEDSPNPSAFADRMCELGVEE